MFCLSNFPKDLGFAKYKSKHRDQSKHPFAHFSECNTKSTYLRILNIMLINKEVIHNLIQ